MIYNGQKIITPYYIVELAREQRCNLTESENILWKRLKNKQLNGNRFRCQHPVYRYILDFYCHKAHLAIEIDGEIHKKRKDYDTYRDNFLESIGIKTLRVSVEKIMFSVDDTVERIRNELNSGIK